MHNARFFIPLGSLAAMLALTASAALAADAPPGRETIVAGSDSAKIERRYAFNAEGSVEISNIRGSVTVTGGDEAAVKLDGSLGGGSQLIVDGGARRLSLRVESRSGGDDLNNLPHHDTTLRLGVPHGVRLKLALVNAGGRVDGLDGRTIEISSVNGSVHIDAAARSIDVESVNGSVEVTAARPGAVERAHLQTVGGDILVRGVDGRLRLGTVSGRLDYTAPTVGELNAESVSGPIRASVAPAKGARLRLDTLSGDLHLRLPASVSAHIHAETFSGSLKSDFGTPARAGFGAGSSLDATPGDGDARIDAQSFSGNVEIGKQ